MPKAKKEKNVLLEVLGGIKMENGNVELSDGSGKKSRLHKPKNSRTKQQKLEEAGRFQHQRDRDGKSTHWEDCTAMVPLPTRVS